MNARPRRLVSIVSGAALTVVAVLVVLLVVDHRGGPVPATQTVVALPDTTDGVHEMLVFNSKLTDYQQERGVIDYVWGADCQGRDCTANRAVPGVWHEYYIPWARDGVRSDRSLDWFVTEHPDWVLYTGPECNGRSTYGSRDCVAFSSDAGERHTTVPLDYTNPEVQDYIFENWIDPNMTSSSPFSGISWDDNWSSGATGNWSADGTWQARFNGQYGTDPGWTATQTKAFVEMRDRFKATYPNGSWSLNDGFFPYENMVGWDEKVRAADMFMHEGGFTARVQTLDQWRTTVDRLVTEQRDHGLGLMLVNQLPYPLTAYLTDTDPKARADMEWALANYLLVKYDRTYFWIGAVANYGEGPATLRQRETDPALAASNADAIGRPADAGRGTDYYQNGSVFMRDYSNGLAVVNPSPDTPAQVTLPAGNFRTASGTAVSGTVTLPARSGLVLVKGA